MFGHVQANMQDLNQEEQHRYRSAYCGLCRSLGKRHGFFSRLSLTYDLTFLTLLLSSLYEPEDAQGSCRCCVHPCKKHDYSCNEYTDYAADMTIALAYHKCMDDWKDEHNLTRRLYAAYLKPRYEKVKAQWPRQCAAIEKSMIAISAIEAEPMENTDAAAKCFGRLMEALFVYRQDHWENDLRKLGNSLGRFIYLADAAVDLEEDRRRKNYNPLLFLSSEEQNIRPLLTTVLGDASQSFEYLPLVQDVRLLKNILYSGLWIKFNQHEYKMEQKKKKVKA